MRAARGIFVLLLLVCTSPAFFYPTEDNAVTESTDDVLKPVAELVDTDNEYSNKEETIDDEDLVDPSDDHPDVSEPDAEPTEDQETGLSPDSVDPEESGSETAAEVPEESPENNELSEVEERGGRQLKTDSTNGTAEASHSGRGRKPKPPRLGGRPSRRRPARRKPARRRPAHKRKHPANRRRPLRGRRPHRRPFNSRRGPFRKPVNKGRSSEVEQTNKLIDMILANFSATIEQKSFQEEIRITAVPDNIKILPWAYRTISTTEEAVLRAASHMEDTESEQGSPTDTCTDTSDVTGTNSTCTTTTNSTTEVNPEDTEDLGADYHIEEQETHEEEKKPNASEKEAEKEGSEVDTDDEDDNIYTKDPYPVLKGNDTVEYYVQLLHPKHASLFVERRATNETVDNSGSEKAKVEDDNLNEVEPAAEEHVDVRKKRSAGKKDFKKPDPFNAVITGLDRIKRSRDVKTVGRNSLKIHRIPLSIGPLNVHFKEPVSSALFNRTSITTEELPALLVIKETGGRLVAARFASKHATPFLAQVTLRRSSEGPAPDKLDTGRLVTHLSQELARLWNRSILLSKISREFKKLFINKKVLKRN